MKRAISEDFMYSLQNGELRPILDLIKKDGSLDLEMRGIEIVVYYQGLRLLSIKENGPHVYEFVEMNKEYRRRKNGTDVQLPVLSLDNIEDYIIKGKYVMDTYDMKNHFEYEVKQMIVKENNIAPIAAGTDFYVIDTEYQNENKDQFDIVALHIDSDGAIRKKGEASIAVIEIKQGITTLKTTSTNPGIRQHLDDFNNFVNDKERKEDFISDMKEIALQKYELGLFNGLQPNTMKRLNIKDNIEFYIALSDYKAASSNLKNELNSFSSECNFLTSSFMGYGLYSGNIKSKQEILQLLK